MDYGPRDQAESFISQVQVRAAFRTHYLILAAKIVFLFSHGLLVIASSLSLRHGLPIPDFTWWEIFMPVWFGNVICCVLVVCSWFASCPYVQLCLSEQQARLGSANPSIMTEILPDIVMAMIGSIFVVLVLIGEVLLCRYLANLDADVKPKKVGDDSFVPSGCVLLLVAMLATCRGVCISTDGELFYLLGFAAISMLIAALCVPGGLVGAGSWIVLVPAPCATLGLLLAAIHRSCLKKFTMSREERCLRAAEQMLLGLIVVALGLMSWLLAVNAASYESAALGASVGGGLCLIAVLRTWMAFAECRRPSAREQISLQPSPSGGCSIADQ